MRFIKFNLLLLSYVSIFLLSCSSDDNTATQSECEIPSNIDELTFTEKFRFIPEANVIGMLADESNDLIYIACRSVENVRGERIIKYNVETEERVSLVFDQQDLVTKEMEIVNDRLLVFGGEYVNSYPLDISEDPISILHSKRLTRFGTAVYKDDIYVAGGDINSGSPEANLILKYDLTSSKFETEAVMPEKKVWADSEIVNNKMYVFGGAPSFVEDDGTNDILIYNFSTRTFEQTLRLPKDVTDTFVTKCDNLIYVGGKRHIPFDGIPGSAQRYESFLGIFDTRDNTFREVDISGLDQGDSTLQQIAILKNQLFIVYGDGRKPFDGFTVLAAQLKKD